MKYLVLLIGDGAAKPWPEQTESEQMAAMATFGEFDAACAARDGVELLGAVDEPAIAHDEAAR